MFKSELLLSSLSQLLESFFGKFNKHQTWRYILNGNERIMKTNGSVSLYSPYQITMWGYRGHAVAMFIFSADQISVYE